MNWTHMVDIDWLIARRRALTATDIVKLMPDWKKLKNKKYSHDDVLPMFAAVWYEKHTRTLPDPFSSGAAARGHIMEPYAVEEYNEHFDGELYHWDDAIIVNNGLGFSPDAMDIKQVNRPVLFETPGYVTVVNKCNKGGYPVEYFVDTDGQISIEYQWEESVPYGMGNAYMPCEDLEIVGLPKHILEVKCYGAEHHVRCVLKDKMQQDELMQIATAFAVLPKLEEATLMFYCPDSPISMVKFDYTRDELQEQIDIASEVSSLYASQAMKMGKILDKFPHIKPLYSDKKIWNFEMNPELTRLR